jgi:hypothetical protein
MDELLPQWLALVALEEDEPLRRLVGHVKHCQEHLASVRSLLDAEELIASVEPRQWIFSAIVRGKQQLVSMLGGVGDGVGIVWGCCLAVASGHGR